eukprot:CFRG8094T1
MASSTDDWERQPLLDVKVYGGSIPRTAHPPARKSMATGGRMVQLPAAGTKPAQQDERKEIAKGRVTVYCTAGSYDKKELRRHLELKQKNLGAHPLKFYQDALYLDYQNNRGTPLGHAITQEVFFFEYGVVVFWGLSETEEQNMLEELENYEINKLGNEGVDIDEFEFVIDPSSPPRLEDDVITINNSQDYRLRLAISYALSQSTKLSVFEEMIDKTIETHKNVPVNLAKTGKVHMSRNAIARIIGQLFMQASEVNLVSNVLDTPDFFWEEPDYLESLYRAIRIYLEITRRVDILNRRLRVVHEMMSILKDEQHQQHGEKLEWIVIWLIVIEIVIGIAGVMATVFTSSVWNDK